MRYSARFIARKRPNLDGRIVPLGAGMAGTCCHEFEATDDIEVCYGGGKEFVVRLVAHELVKSDKLYGPASLRDKTLIYPCEEFKCRIRCPCTMCRNKMRYGEDFEDLIADIPDPTATPLRLINDVVEVLNDLGKRFISLCLVKISKNF